MKLTDIRSMKYTPEETEEILEKCMVICIALAGNLGGNQGSNYVERLLEISDFAEKRQKRSK